MIRAGKRAYEYLQAFERGLSDYEIARKFKVSLETVGRYKHLAKYYDLADLGEIVIRLRERRCHLSTIYKAVRNDPRFDPFDDMFLLTAICRRIRQGGRVISELELRAALRYAFDPEVHDEAQSLLSSEVESSIADQ